MRFYIMSLASHQCPQDFLPVFAAGNYGDLDRGSSAGTGAITVTAPATCKNCISVGATPTYLEGGLCIPASYVVHQGLISTADGTQRPWKVLFALPLCRCLP